MIAQAWTYPFPAELAKAASRCGQPTASRDERVRDTLLQTLAPLLLLLPRLLLLVGVIIQAGFRLLSILVGRPDARASVDLRTLPFADIPLFGRFRQMFEQRRRFVADTAHESRTPVTAPTVQADNLSRLDLSPGAAERPTAVRGGIRRVGPIFCSSSSPSPATRPLRRRRPPPALSAARPGKKSPT